MVEVCDMVAKKQRKEWGPLPPFSRPHKSYPLFLFSCKSYFTPPALKSRKSFCCLSWKPSSDLSCLICVLSTSPMLSFENSEAKNCCPQISAGSCSFQAMNEE